MDRTFVTREVPPAQHSNVSRTAVAVTSGVWVATGFLLAVGVLLLRPRRRHTSAVPGGRTLVLLAAVSRGCGPGRGRRGDRYPGRIALDVVVGRLR